MASQHNQAGFFIRSLRKDCDICTELELLHAKIDDLKGAAPPGPGGSEQEDGGTDQTWVRAPYTPELSPAGASTYDPHRKVYVDSRQPASPGGYAFDPYSVSRVMTDESDKIPTHPSGRVVKLVAGRVVVTEEDGTTVNRTLIDDWMPPNQNMVGSMFYMADKVLVMFGSPSHVLLLDRTTLDVVGHNPNFSWTPCVPGDLIRPNGYRATGFTWKDWTAYPLFGDRIVAFLRHLGAGGLFMTESLLADMETGKVLYHGVSGPDSKWGGTAAANPNFRQSLFQSPLDDALDGEVVSIGGIESGVAFQGTDEYLYVWIKRDHSSAAFGQNSFCASVRRVRWAELCEALDGDATSVVLSAPGDASYMAGLREKLAILEQNKQPSVCTLWDDGHFALFGRGPLNLWDIARGGWTQYDYYEGVTPVQLTHTMQNVRVHEVSPRERTIVIDGVITPSDVVVYWETDGEVKRVGMKQDLMELDRYPE